MKDSSQKQISTYANFLYLFATEAQAIYKAYKNAELHALTVKLNKVCMDYLAKTLSKKTTANKK